MKLVIVDASVAIKWFVNEERGKDRALSWLDKLKTSPKSFAVPELFFNEMLAVFCRLLDTSEEVERYMNILQDLGLERIGNGRKLLTKAAMLAKEYNLSGYDAIYAAAAELVNGQWLTADERAYNKIKNQHCAILL